MWGYIDFSNKIVARLAGGSGGPSATSMGGNMSGGIEQYTLSKIGLDAQSRKNIKDQFKSRAKSMRRGDKHEPLSKSNRKDKSDGDNNSRTSSPNSTEENANAKNRKSSNIEKTSSLKSSNPKEVLASQKEKVVDPKSDLAENEKTKENTGKENLANLPRKDVQEKTESAENIQIKKDKENLDINKKDINNKKDD
jgi:hypothetical protein